MILLNGRGQLGDSLKGYTNQLSDDVVIYHTWNFLDKSQSVQLIQQKKFLQSLQKNKGKKIIFISTRSKRDDFYVKRKRRSQQRRLRYDSKIIRLPALIGKGICTKLLKNQVKPYGRVQLMSIQDRRFRIMQYIKYRDNSWQSVPNIMQAQGQWISRKLLKNIIDFSVQHVKTS